MANWPPVSRGRRPRSWYVYYNSTTVHYDSTNHAGCLGDHQEGIIIKDPVTMTTGTWIMRKSLKDIVAVNDNDFNKGAYSLFNVEL